MCIRDSYLPHARNDRAISATSPRGLSCVGRKSLPYWWDAVRHRFVDRLHDRVAQLFLPAFPAVARCLRDSIRLVAPAFGLAVRYRPAVSYTHLDVYKRQSRELCLLEDKDMGANYIRPPRKRNKASTPRQKARCQPLYS